MAKIKPKSAIVAIIVCCVMPFALSSCIKLGGAYPEKRFFLLHVSREKSLSSIKTNNILLVKRFHVISRYEGRSFVYRKGDYVYESDFYNRFFVYPSAFLTEAVRKWLADSGLFLNVLDPASQVEQTHILEGTVTALYGDYSREKAPKAVLAIRFLLLSDDSKGSEVLFKKEYEQKVTLETESAPSLVHGWSRGLHRVLTELEKDIDDVFSRKGT